MNRVLGEIPYEEILNNVSDAIIAIDAVGELIYFNRQAREKLDIAADVYGRTITELFPESLCEYCLTADNNSDKQIIQFNGKRFSCRFWRYRSGSQQQRFFIISEIGVLEKIKKELAEVKSLKNDLDAVVDASFDYIFVTDGEGNVLRINNAYTRITGLKAEEVLGKNIYDLIEQGFYDRAATIEVIQTGKSATFTQTIKTGKTVLVTGNPVFDEKGVLKRVVTNGRDVTELDQLKQEVEQAQKLRQHYQQELQKIQIEGDGDHIIASAKMKEVSDLILRIAKVDSTVLIIGESGVGKEIIARELHRNSMRADRPYICVNCAAIPDNLLESELFGYEEGAFTGAKRGGKMGVFQMANRGTLFLDEIGDLPFYLQAKLLRVIQENEIMRVGGTKPIPIDVRIITATNRNLWQMVNERKFREDFYYRLNVVQVRIPPLRERKEEISVFVDYFINSLNKKYNVNKRLDPRLLQKMINYDWPGNVRELRNAIEQAFVTSPDFVISEIRLGPEQKSILPNAGDKSISLKNALQEYEARLIREAVLKHGTTRKAAAALGLSQTTLWRKARQYGIRFQNSDS